MLAPRDFSVRHICCIGGVIILIREKWCSEFGRRQYGVVCRFRSYGALIGDVVGQAEGGAEPLQRVEAAGVLAGAGLAVAEEWGFDCCWRTRHRELVVFDFAVGSEAEIRVACRLGEAEASDR